MLFQLFRLSLLPRAQVDAFEPRTPDGGLLSREEWLRPAFSTDVEFLHRRKRFLFKPYTGMETGDFVAGAIGRKVKMREDRPTSAGYEPTEIEHYRAATFLLDPRAHGDGQMIGFEDIQEVGQPLAILSSLVKHLNSIRPPPPYLIEAGVISEPSDFWEFVQKHRGEITTATFEFIAPNMFGIDTDYDREMKSLQEQEQVEHASLKLKATQGLNLETDRVRKAVEYISRGTGVARARTRRGAQFNSENAVRRAAVPDDEGPLHVPRSLPQRIRMALQVVFGQ